MPGAVATEPIGTSTVMACLLFGTNFFLFVLFQLIKYYSKPNEEVAKPNEKKMSKPFLGTLECYTNLTTEVFRTGCVMLLTYVCEKHWYYEHSTKSYSRDLFLFVLILFFAYGFYTIKPIHDLTLLGREQTEEWKGWMQFIFLLYHYFHAEEVYNSVRVMITCYVWMTGFGNFSFFYIKRDFGWLRIVQMLWRLNFSVLLLMWTHGNTYILYYICPLHTFYFLMVYATMVVYSSINNTKWAIRVKLFIVGIIIFIVWDYNHGIFDFLFAWMGTDKIIGANSGSVWEYYFRTSLDHWSSFLGMIFALNFPLAEQYFVKARGWPVYVGGAIMIALFTWWYNNYYQLEKMEYNLTHSYFAIIPLTSYVFVRNINPYVRGFVSMSMHDLGKTTLETYLLQHHIWLTSNAKTLLTIVQDKPWVNFALATMLFFTVAKELYRLTMSLRGMVLPEDPEIAKRNLLGLTSIIGVLGTFAYILHTFETFSVVELFLACNVLALCCLAIIRSMNKSLAETPAYSYWSGKAMIAGVLLLVVGAAVQLIINSAAKGGAAAMDLNAGSSSSVGAAAKVASFTGNSPSCLGSIPQGHWNKVPCSTTAATSGEVAAFCEMDQWNWDKSLDTSKCPVTHMTAQSFKYLFSGKKVAFVGDSGVRNVYHQFNAQLDPTYKHNQSYAFKHQDLSYSPSFDTKLAVKFVWAPFVSNVTAAYKSHSLENYDLVVAGGILWDALHLRDLSAFSASIDSLAAAVSSDAGNQTVSLWMHPLTVIDAQLNSADKLQFMNQQIVEQYRQAMSSHTAANKAFRSVFDPSSASRNKGEDSVDGVHYTGDVYDVVVQMISNIYALQSSSTYKQSLGLGSTSSSSSSSGTAAAVTGKKYVPKVTGSMSLPGHGLGVLALAFVMIFLMDSWLGVGWFTLFISGNAYDWEAAYSALHKKIFSSGLPTTAPPSVAAAAPAVDSSNGNNGGGSKFDKSSDDGVEIALEERTPFISKK